MKLFTTFCDLLGFDSLSLSENQLCKVCWLYCHSRSVSTLDSWLSGVAKSLKDLEAPELPRHDVFRDNKKGLKAIFGPVDGRQPATPITEDDLRALRRSLRRGEFSQDSFWLCSLLGFQGLLRAGEIADGRLRLSDITLNTDSLTIKVPFSKANPSPVNVVVATRDDELCPVQAYRQLLRSMPDSAHGKICAKTYNAFNSEFKRRFSYAGVIKPNLSSHSMRRGGATAMFAAGVPTLTIMSHGRWASDAWKQYVEHGPVLQLRATQLLHSAASI